MSKRKFSHGGKRKGAGKKPSPFISKTERLAFLNEAEREAYMKISPRQRVLLVLNAEKCDECGAILDVLPHSSWRICNECN